MELIQSLHALLRWPILILGVAGLAMTLASRRSMRVTPQWIRMSSGLFVGALDLQFLLGILLLVLSSEARDSQLPHAVSMMAAVVLAHLMRVRARRRPGRGGSQTLYFVLPLGLVGLGLWLLS